MWCRPQMVVLLEDRGSRSRRAADLEMSPQGNELSGWSTHLFPWLSASSVRFIARSQRRVAKTEQSKQRVPETGPQRREHLKFDLWPYEVVELNQCQLVLETQFGCYGVPPEQF